MATSTSTRRPSRIPGAKILLTASALAATFGGWAALTWKEAAQAAAAAPSLQSAEAQLAAAGIMLEPLPTLVAVPTNLPVGDATLPLPSVQQPVLRSVSRPPAPRAVTVTRSSRP
jgi:hypothetical protein